MIKYSRCKNLKKLKICKNGLQIGGHFYCSIVLMTFAGTPAIKLFAGISLVTTAPAAITHPAPIVTPGITETLAPNQQLSPTLDW